VKKILISGGGGRLAKQIIKHNVEYEVAAPTKKEMDITTRSSVETCISKYAPDIFLHAAAYTRPMKKHQDNPGLSVETNIIGTANVVLACIEQNIKLVYISTDYVYPGTRGDYKEEDPVSPYGTTSDGIAKYGWSKLGGECAVRLYDNSLILRVCTCNRPFPHAQAIGDVKKSYIFEDEAALIILRLLDERGIINVGGRAQTVYDFARNRVPNIKKIFAGDIGDVSMAPDTSMNTDKLTAILERLDIEREAHAKKY